MQKFFIALACGIATLVIGIALFLMTVDPNRYRDEIANALCKQTGRMVRLGGPISFGVSTRGVTLDIRDSTISNPFWASRRVMAGIGHFQLGLSLLPLFSRQIVVTRLDISNADIQLETDKDGRHNWDMIPSERQDPDAPKKDIIQGRPVSVHITRININDSQLSFRNDDGDIRVFNVKSLSLGIQGGGGSLNFNGEYNSTPLFFVLNTGARDLIAPIGSWPFAASLNYANYRAAARGRVDMDEQTANVSSYEIDAGHSTLYGKLTVNWKDENPLLRGNMLSDRLNLADLAPSAAAKGSRGSAAGQSSASSKRMFSDAPFDLDGLKSIDADLDVKIDELILPADTLDKVTTKLQLAGGALALEPFEALVGKGAIKGQIRMNVNQTPPHLAMALSAPDIKLQDLLMLLSAPAFLQGDASASVNIATSGESIHAMAMNAIGVMEVTSSSGSVSSHAAGSIASGLMDLFAPSGSNTLNCLAVRFSVKDGIARDNGILVDTDATTVAGQGGFDLGRETIALTLRAKTKKVNIGDFMPPLRVDGSFTDPGFAIDPSETVENVAGIFTGGAMGGDVPDIISRPGENACIYTLDHPASAATRTVLSPSMTGRAAQQLNTIGDALHGILGQ